MQEKHHYVSTELTYGASGILKRKDDVKEELAFQRGITLVIVPCWWDGTEPGYVLAILSKSTDSIFA